MQITTQPVSQTVYDGDVVIFSVEATGTELEYDWYYSSDGGHSYSRAYTNVTSGTPVTTPYFAFTAALRFSGFKFICYITESGIISASDAATLTVLESPTPTPTPGGGEMFLIINGTDITDYIAHREFKWSRNDVDGPNAGRNILGEMMRDRVATKIRLDIKCRPLTSQQHTTILNLLMSEFVTVQYKDPLYGATSKVMYANNNKSEFLIRRKNGIEYWYNVTFPLIEK